MPEATQMQQCGNIVITGEGRMMTTAEGGLAYQRWL
ncbi:transcriptional regulator FeaR, partial [Klebsiella pneumoniae]